MKIKLLQKKILVIQGANTNMLGDLDTCLYGKEPYESINKQIIDKGLEFNFDIDIFHSNIEGEIINKIQQARESYNGIIINAGAYSHYSIAIRDAIASTKIPTVEIHMSNIYSREEFRQKSIIAPVCAGQVVGFGKNSYFMAIYGLSEMI